MTGGSSNTSIDPQQVNDNLGPALYFAMYDPLITVDADANQKLVLAESVGSNADATQWTIRLKQGPKFHNGKPVTADDLIFSIQRMIKNKYAGAAAYAGVSLDNIKKKDDRTVVVTYDKPFSVYPEVSSSPGLQTFILPQGYDIKNPVGTGPFKYQSYQPGVQATFVRNDDYWQRPAYVDKLVITFFDDENSQVNALLSDQVDMINVLSSTNSQVAQKGYLVTANKTGLNTPFVMRYDQAPFNDPKVRQAMRLIVDRKQMLNLLFSGQGALGNDQICPIDPLYDKSLPQREQNIQQAKSLLKGAGREGLSVQLTTRPSAAGMTQAAQVFAQQAKAAGVTVNVNTVTPSDFYAKYGQWNFCQSNWSYEEYWAQVAYMLVPGAPAWDSHYNNPTYTGLYQQALRSTDEGSRKNIATEMQKIFYDDGSLIIPYFLPLIDGFSNRVQGGKPSPVFSFNYYGWRDFWLS
jgi:ABC-type dipeptide transport system, periplasmic component